MQPKSTTEPAPDASRSSVGRRLAAALLNLPVGRQRRRQRSVLDELSRHAQALRARLDQLARDANAVSEAQAAPTNVQDEADALLWVLSSFVPDRVAVSAAKPRPHNPGYIKKCEDAAQACVAGGFTVVHLERPAWLFHVSGTRIDPIEVSLTVWFYVRGMGEVLSERRPVAFAER